MRRFAGGWVRQQARQRLLVIIAILSAILGAAFTSVLAIAISFLFGPRWISYLPIALAVPAGAYMAWATRSMDRGEIAAWLKGADAEQNIGQAIERALTAAHCAVAHSVTGLTDSGDIDHLVATPAGLWVLETKTRRIPRKEFPRVLHGLARKVKSASEWAPPGTVVRACLVLDNPEGTRRRTYDASGETVLIHNAQSLAKALSAEAGGLPAAPTGLAARVWSLASLDE